MRGRFPFVFMSLVLGEDIEATEVPRGEAGWLLLASLNFAPKPFLRGVLAGATPVVNETEKYERDKYVRSKETAEAQALIREAASGLFLPCSISQT